MCREKLEVFLIHFNTGRVRSQRHLVDIRGAAALQLWSSVPDEVQREDFNDLFYSSFHFILISWKFSVYFGGM